MVIHARRSTDNGVLVHATTIQSLPVEILLSIFALAIQWDVEDWKSTDDIHRRPVLLSHVCSKWRFAILEASTLWTCVAFHRNLGLRTCIARSKQQSVDIVHSSRSSTKEDFNPQFEKVLRETCDRWRTVLWESSELDILDMLTVLNSGATMPRLSTLELGLKKRAIPSVPLYTPPSSSINSAICPFPSLHNICLSRVALTELPSTTYPLLSSLTLHWPAKYPTTRPGLFNLSSILDFLLRTPQLASLSLVKSCPLMDTHVLRLAADALPGRPSSSWSGTQLRVSTLQQLEWSFAPPRDLWRLFLHVEFPKLRQLELYLDAADSRWYTFYGGELEPLDSSDDLPRSLQSAIITFNELEELSLCASDEDGLCTAVKRMEFPKLKKLTLAFLKKHAARVAQAKPVGQRQPAARTLPSVDAIFREPRLTSLTRLTLSDFTLDRSVTMSLLAYMPSLEHLTLDSCEGKHHQLFIDIQRVDSVYRRGRGHLCSGRRSVRKLAHHASLVDVPPPPAPVHHRLRRRVIPLSPRDGADAQAVRGGARERASLVPPVEAPEEGRSHRGRGCFGTNCSHRVVGSSYWITTAEWCGEDGVKRCIAVSVPSAPHHATYPSRSHL